MSSGDNTSDECTPATEMSTEDIMVAAPAVEIKVESADGTDMTVHIKEEEENEDNMDKEDPISPESSQGNYVKFSRKGSEGTCFE